MSSRYSSPSLHYPDYSEKVMRFNQHDKKKVIAFDKEAIEGHVTPLRRYVSSEDGLVNAYDLNYRTLLHYTVLTSEAETKKCITFLLNEGCNINCQTLDHEDTPLHLVLKKREGKAAEDIALFLIEKGADCTVRDKGLRSPYDYALLKNFNRLAAVMFSLPPPKTPHITFSASLRSNSSLDDSSDDEGTERLQMKEQSYIPLDSAELDRLQMKEKGVTRAAQTDPQRPSKDGIAATTPHLISLARVDFLKRRSDELAQPLLDAVKKGDLTKVKEYLVEGANTNYINEHGGGALHYAVHRCPHHRARMVELLCEGGADVNLLDHEQDNALNLAIKTRSNRANDAILEIVTILQQYGAKPTFKDLDGHDAFSMAKTRRLDKVYRLLKAGPQKRRTASHFAMRKGTQTEGAEITTRRIGALRDAIADLGAEVMGEMKEEMPDDYWDVTPEEEEEEEKEEEEEEEYDTEYYDDESTEAPETRDDEEDEDDDDGFDHKHPDANGLYPIHVIVADDYMDPAQREQFIDRFYEASINFDVQTSTGGDTALHLAINADDADVVNKLLYCGANPDIKNKDKVTPRQLIKKRGNPDLKHVLRAFEEGADDRAAAQEEWERAQMEDDEDDEDHKKKKCVVQ